MTKIKVDTIKITIGRKTLELTPEELKELRDVLEATFPSKMTVYMPTAPTIIERPGFPTPWRHWEITCLPKDRTVSLTCQRATAEA